MNPVKLTDALHNAVDEIILGDNAYSYVLFLKDGDGNYHEVCDLDLYRDRITCTDGYQDCYEWILESEKNKEEPRLYKD